MPIGFPSSPTTGQQWPTASPVWEYDGAKWLAIAGTGGAGTPVTDRLSSLVGTDDFIGLRAGAPYLVAASVIGDYVGGAPADTAPAAFTSGQWTAAATSTAGEISFNLTALPADGGSPITALEYRVGTGAAIAFAGTGTGVRVVTAGLTAGVAVDLQVRAVNAVGAGAWSDIKSRTPAASGGGGSLAIVQAPAAASQPFATSVVVSCAAFAAGHAGVLVVRSWTGAVSHSAVDSNGDSWGSPVYTVTGPDEIYSFFVRNGVAAGVTSVTVTGASDAGWEAALVEVSGQGAGLVLDGAGATGALASSATHNVPFTSTAAAVVMVASTLANGTTSTGTAPLSVKSAAGEYGCVANGLFPTPGAQNATFTIPSALSGQYARVALKAS